MKLVILTAIIAAVASSPVSQANDNWPWQVGKVYSYDLYSHTLNNFEEGISHGSAFMAHLIVSVKPPGRLHFKLENPLYAPVKAHIRDNFDVLKSLDYQPIKKYEQTFEVVVDNGRVISMHVPSTLSVSDTNFLKALVSAFQIDLTPYGHVHDYPNSFDRNTFQGLFKKFETDVTGDCETLYSVSPMPSEWRRELPKFTNKEDPVEVVKSRNYANCHKRANVYAGVPESVVFENSNNTRRHMIDHTYKARFVVGKQGPIYRADVTSLVAASPLVFGNQKTEVFSYIKFDLNSIEQDTPEVAQKHEGELRLIDSLLYKIDSATYFSYDDKQGIARVQKLLEEIAPMLQNPNDMPKGKFLLKFNMIIYILTSLNSEQLTQLSKTIEIPKSSKDVAKYNMWTVYRDAVALTNSVAAYEQIKFWVLNDKIKGLEAVELISTMSATLTNPSAYILKDFFKFATNPVVTELKYVNNSALLASSKLWSMAKEDEFVEKVVIPYLDKELKQAILSKDLNKAQVYVRVLINLAHPSILKVFIPYLEGQIAVTNYLRTQIVANLKTLADVEKEQIQAILYSIIKNTAEPYEVRVAAAYSIVYTAPTTDMMAILAKMTHVDPSYHVRAAIASTIKRAAEMKDPALADLIKNAQSVLNDVSNEQFHSAYSSKIAMDGYTNKDDPSYFGVLSTIGSKNSVLPKYIRTMFGIGVTSAYEDSEVTLSMSDVEGFMDYFMQALYEPNDVDPKFKFSAQKIMKMLNIKPVSPEPLEGSLYVNDENQQTFVTLNIEEFYSFMMDAGKVIEDLVDGKYFQYSKILYSKRKYVIFPLATGMPYRFESTEPIVFMIKTSTGVSIDKKSKDLAGSLKTTIDFTYGKSIMSAISFIDLLGNQLPVSGVLGEMQFYVPLKINTQFNGEQFKLKFEPLYNHKDVNLIHYNVFPYTGMYKLNSLAYDVEPLMRSTKTVSSDVTFGDFTGSFYSYSKDFEDSKKLFDEDLFENIGEYIYLKDIALTDFQFKYLAKQSQVKSVTLSIYSDTLYNQQNGGEMGKAYLTKNLEPNSAARREEIVKKVSSDIDSAEVELFDFSTEIEGPKKSVYVFTGAYAYSVVDPKFQAAFFAYGGEQISGVFKLNTKMPKLKSLNFKEALETEIKLTYDAHLKFQDSDFYLQGYGMRSKEYTEKLKKDPMAKTCLQDISNNNFLQKDCYNMTVKAYAPDFFKFSVTYKELDSSLLNLTQYTYNNYIKPVYSLEDQLDFLVKSEKDKIETQIQFNYYDNYVDFNFKSKFGSFKQEKVETTWDYPYIMTTYVPLATLENSFDWFSDYESLPYCAVDDNKVSTFSGRTYDYALTGSWHVVMVEDANAYNKDLVILSRRPSANQEEVYVSYKTENGKFFEIDIKPDHVEVKSNGNKTCHGALTMYWDDSDEIPLLEYFKVGEGIYVFDIHGNRLRLVYDKQRLVIFTDEYYSRTMGLCGQSSTEPYDDYLTPWGLVDLPEYYGASFSLEGEFSDPKTVALKKEAKLKAYQPVTKFTNILRSDDEWTKAMKPTPKENCDK